MNKLWTGLACALLIVNAVMLLTPVEAHDCSPIIEDKPRSSCWERPTYNAVTGEVITVRVCE